MDRESQETVDQEKAAQEVLQAQLEELVSALKASTMIVHTSLREQNKVSKNGDSRVLPCGDLMMMMMR